MRHQKVYRFTFAQTGELIVEGTVSQCAAALNTSVYGVRNAIFRAVNEESSKYRVEEILDENQSKAPHPALLEAANAWDAFMEPIRKAYGIPVYGTRMEG